MRKLISKISKGPVTYFISTPTRDHIPIFELPHLAEQAVLQLGRTAKEGNAALAGYAVMPALMMAIVAFKGDHDLGGFVYNYKKLSALAIIGLDHGQFRETLYRKGKFRPWMRRLDYKVICSKEQLQSYLDYLHTEPVNKGLVTCPDNWPYSSARDWANSEQGMISIEKELSWAGIV